MSKNEMPNETITFGGHLLALIRKGAIDSLWDEMATPRPKSEKEALLKEIRRLETIAGIEHRKYNGS